MLSGSQIGDITLNVLMLVESSSRTSGPGVIEHGGNARAWLRAASRETRAGWDYVLSHTYVHGGRIACLSA